MAVERLVGALLADFVGAVVEAAAAERGLDRANPGALGPGGRVGTDDRVESDETGCPTGQ
jgi:hypothetical protein